jgi:OOP family OmpA-OmpF porin
MKMMSKTLLAAALMAAGSLTAGQVDAQVRGNDWGNYLGASIGDSDLDTTLKIYGGQGVAQYWGWEASYIDFGSRTNGSVTTEAWGLGAALVGVLPLNPQFSAFGKLGAYYVDAEVSRPGSNVSDSDVEAGIGVGLRFAINPQFSLRLEFESIGGEGGDVFSLGAQFRF